MAKRTIGICDAAPSSVDRQQLPLRLCEALRSVKSDVERLGFDVGTLQPSQWIWDWNPDYDGPYLEWLLGKTVGLSWPNAEGISVICSNHVTQVCTGVRWEAVNHDREIREVVADVVLAIGRSLGAKKAWLIPDAGDAMAEKVMDMVFEDASSSELAAVVERSAVVHALSAGK